MNAEQIQAAETIDAYAKEIMHTSRSEDEIDERILTSMADKMPLFKQLLDTCSASEMDQLIHRYDGLYRFSQFLERLAQGIRDGVIDVPGKPSKKKRPRKPKPKRRPKSKKRQAQQPQQVRRDISFLPTYTELILGELAHTEEQYQTFLSVRERPHVLDDSTVDRAIKAYEDQLAFLPLHEKQFHWWLSEALTDAQQFQVKDLKSKLSLLKSKTEQVLALLAEIKAGTINRILEMDEGELIEKIQRGEINPPF